MDTQSMEMVVYIMGNVGMVDSQEVVVVYVERVAAGPPYFCFIYLDVSCPDFSVPNTDL